MADPPDALQPLADTFGTELVDRVNRLVVGRAREVEGVVAALAEGRHLLLEGPPGTGKSTLLRAVAGGAGLGFEFVEGNAELTPARLIGTFDPARVLTDGYVPEVFLDGPLVRALRDGSLLYVEEINRVPEETLNVLITVMSEAELHVPRLGTVHAAPGFALVAAMNPFDAVGTARISSAVYDRCCRLALDYQDADAEQAIVSGNLPGAGDPTSGAAPANSPVGAEFVGGAFVGGAVALTRATRRHPDLRTGSSVRGAIDLVRVGGRLGRLRGSTPEERGVSLDATLLALSGRVRVRDGCTRTPEDILTDLWRQHLAPLDPDGPEDGPESSADSPGDPSAGKAPTPAGQHLARGLTPLT